MNLLPTLTVREKLRWLLLGLLLVLFTNGYLFYLFRNDLSESQEFYQDINQTATHLALVYQAQQNMTALRRELIIAFNISDSEQKKLIIVINDAIAKSEKRYRNKFNEINKIDNNTYVIIEKTIQELYRVSRLGAQAISLGDRKTGFAEVGNFPLIGKPADAALAALNLSLQAKLKNTRQDLERRDNERIFIVFFSLGSLLLFVSIMVVVLVQSLSKPLATLTKFLQALSLGQFLQEAPSLRKDEFGQIAQALSQLGNFTQQLNRIAYFDSLTQILNRSSLERALDDYVLNGQKFALLFIDIDRFRLVNEGYGHGIGDNCLKTIAQRLEELHEERAFHYSGDLYAVALLEKDYLGIEHVGLEAERVRGYLNYPIQIKDLEIRLTVSIGVSFWPEHGKTLIELVSAADAALYRAKKSGRNSVQIVEGNFGADARERLERVEELKSAIEQHQIKPYFQPIVNSVKKELATVEVLSRWLLPNGDIRMPDDFIPLATEAGLIDKLTRSVFSQATQVVGGWWKLGYKFKIAMNWSAQQLNEEAAKRILRTLHEAELPPTALELEITEGVMIENSEQVAPMLASLKIKGVTICLDDFGTGYSSLSYLQRFPIDKIKIDKSFVSNMLEQREAQQIVIITTALAKNLNLKLVAEGIEDLEQAQYLNELGCHFHQGFLYSKALQGSELLLWAEQAGYLKKER